MAPIDTGHSGAPSLKDHSDKTLIFREHRLCSEDPNDADTLEQVFRVWQYNTPYNERTAHELQVVEKLLFDTATLTGSWKQLSITQRALKIHEAIDRALEAYLRSCGYIICYGTKGLCCHWLPDMNIRPLASWVPIDKITFEEFKPQEFYGPDILWLDEKSKVFGNCLHGANQP